MFRPKNVLTEKYFGREIFDTKIQRPKTMQSEQRHRTVFCPKNHSSEPDFIRTVYLTKTFRPKRNLASNRCRPTGHRPEARSLRFIFFASDHASTDVKPSEFANKRPWSPSCFPVSSAPVPVVAVGGLFGSVANSVCPHTPGISWTSPGRVDSTPGRRPIGSKAVYPRIATDAPRLVRRI